MDPTRSRPNPLDLHVELAQLPPTHCHDWSIVTSASAGSGPWLTRWLWFWPMMNRGSGCPVGRYGRQPRQAIRSPVNELPA